MKNKLFLISFLIILAISAFFRFYKFDTIPFGQNHDGAQDALQSIDLIQNPLPYHPYLPGGSGETLFKYYLGVIIKLFGASVKTIKFGSSLLSFLTIPLFYLMVKELSNRRLALFSTFLLSISGWQIIMGKTVWRAISTPLFEVITLLMLFKALNKRSPMFYILTGIFLSLTLNTYNGARSLFILILLILTGDVFFRLVKRKQSLKDWLSIGLFLLSFSLSVFPLANYAINNLSEFNSRLNTLSVFEMINQEKNISPLIENVQKSLLIFNVRANGDDFFISQPLLDQPTSILFIIGVVICLLTIKKTLSWFSILGVLINLLPGLISVPNGNRNIATMPFVYLTAGIALDSIWLFIRSFRFFQAKLISIVIISVICLYGISNTYQLYLGKNRREIWGFYPETTIVGNYMKDRVNNFDIYLTDNYPNDALTFLTYQGGDPFLKHYTWLERKEDFLTVDQKNKGIIFVMFNNPDNLAFVPLLKQRFPNGKVSELKYIDDNINRPAALIYKVPKI